KAVTIARGIAGPMGFVVLITDHDEIYGQNVELLSVGRQVDNVGFCGLAIESDTEGKRWKALVRNYGSTPQSRRWWGEVKDARKLGGTVDLNAGQTITLSGAFPEDVKSFVLYLDDDAFALDDSLPIVTPQAKKIKVLVGKGADEKFTAAFLGTLEDVESASGRSSADLIIRSNDAKSVDDAAFSEIVFASGGGADENKPVILDPIVAENHPLMAGLSWQGLLCAGPAGMVADREDTVLLWQKKTPLIFLRSTLRSRRLFINLVMDNSNADRHPAFVVM
ncbi:unnamed protein product, partial [marine sediment metagenome]